MNNINQNELPEYIRELKRKLEALDALMELNAKEIGGAHFPFSNVNHNIINNITTTQ